MAIDDWLDTLKNNWQNYEKAYDWR
jgi:hypothetical protein